MLILMIVLVLTAWLGGLMVQLEREISAARRRGRAARDKEQKLSEMIENMLAEETSLRQRIADQEQANEEIRHRVDRARTDLTTRQTTGKSRLLVLNARRRPADKDWIVTLVNPTQGRIDASQPLAQEWAAGRDYLVFAQTEQDARERALRRFASRPGVAVKASGPAPIDLYNTAMTSHSSS